MCLVCACSPATCVCCWLVAAAALFAATPLSHSRALTQESLTHSCALTLPLATREGHCRFPRAGGAQGWDVHLVSVTQKHFYHLRSRLIGAQAFGNLNIINFPFS